MVSNTMSHFRILLWIGFILLLDRSAVGQSPISTFEVTNGDTVHFQVPAPQLVIGSDTLNRVDDHGLAQGEWYHTFPDGTYKCSGSYKDGRKDGFWEKCYANGSVRYRINLRDGYLDGPAEFYYPNAVLRETGTFRRGVQHGVFKEYDPAGNLARVEHFKAGYSDGEVELFGRDGVLVGTGETARDRRTGSWRFNYEEGTLLVKYRKGRMISSTVVP